MAERSGVTDKKRSSEHHRPATTVLWKKASKAGSVVEWTGTANSLVCTNYANSWIVGNPEVSQKRSLGNVRSQGAYSMPPFANDNVLISFIIREQKKVTPSLRENQPRVKKLEDCAAYDPAD
jgi:hypothetical protein